MRVESSRSLTAIVMVLYLSCFSSPVLAGDLLVGPGEQYTTIQAAIDAATNGDRVIVAEGTYNENISFGAKDIILTSANPDDPNAIVGTVIQGDGTTSVVTIANNERTCGIRLIGFTITGGDNTVYGGGIYVNNPYSYYRPEIIKCIITGNRADYGGAISGCNGDIVNCLIVHNEANILCGGLDDCGGDITNCTVANNIGGAVNNCSESIANCIIWDNGDNPIINPAYISYSCFPGGSSGTGNIDADPCFVDPDDGDYHLQWGSPCIDAGSNGKANDWLAPYDLDGYPRIIGTVDMGAYEYHDYDCDGNGVNDIEDILNDPSLDCNGNWILDECDIANGTSLDVNGNGIPDECEPDCNKNGVPDDWDIATETSTDYNGNGIPDECEPDCNGNGVPDDWDIATKTSTDYNGNGIPDECEPDCNGNGVPDDWDISQGTSTDENGNGIPDECETVYVDANAPPDGNGTSWATAYNDLQDALDVAGGPGGIIMVRVAAGTYTPDRGAGDRTATFQLINGVAIIGGYAGLGAPDPDARDVKAYETILSGDLDGNDVGDLNDPSRGENSYHVVNGSGTSRTAVLDGFTITGGNANGSSDNRLGGGIYIEQYSSPTLTDCTISGNSARIGGGMYNCEEGNLILINCIISNNKAEVWGGGIYNWGYSNPVLTNCTIGNNTAGSSGGGMYNHSSSDATLTNCTFAGNSANLGGGMFNSGYSEPTLTNCTFRDNTARSRGGGMYDCAGVPTLANCTFTGNSAEYGGVMYNEDSNPTLTNCTFVANSASYGNALACDSYQQEWPSNVQITNCILWDGGDEVWNNDNSAITITYSDVQGGWPGGSNIDADPCFADADNGDYHLQSHAGRWDPNQDSWVIDGNTSACIDGGDPNFGCGRELWPHGRRTNMGAYGGTPQASMSLSSLGNIADLNNDDIVDYLDMRLLADGWVCQGVLLPGDLDRDEIVDFKDFAAFAQNWQIDLRPRVLDEDFETGDFSKYDWQHAGDANWVVVSDANYEGSYSARSGAISDGMESLLRMAVSTYFGSVSFYCKVSSEADEDYLRFYIDDQQQANWSGEQEWSLQQYVLTPGPHTLKWSYEKDSSMSSGSDCSWIDKITVTGVMP